MDLGSLPYEFASRMGVTEITGCSPYGASLAGARFQGAHVAKIALKLKG